MPCERIFEQLCTPFTRDSGDRDASIILLRQAACASSFLLSSIFHHAFIFPIWLTPRHSSHCWVGTYHSTLLLRTVLHRLSPSSRTSLLSHLPLCCLSCNASNPIEFQPIRSRKTHQKISTNIATQHPAWVFKNFQVSWNKHYLLEGTRAFYLY